MCTRVCWFLFSFIRANEFDRRSCCVHVPVCARARVNLSRGARICIYIDIFVCVCVCIVLSLCRKRTMELKMFGVCKGSVRSMRICSETEIVVFIVNG